jgi:NAD(P)-dependent dehydrogenase (short-subunit alcohol dehydrogenase family)
MDLERVVTEIKSNHGYVNVVIANSGISGPSMQELPQNASVSEFRNFVLNWDPVHLAQTFSVNTIGVFNTAAAFLELLDEGNKRGDLKQRSQFIATGSIGAFNRSPVGGYAYGASKAAVVHIAKQLATSLIPYNIRANVISPGCKLTSFQSDLDFLN